MCVAVVIPAGQRLTDEQIRAMHYANSDSYGFSALTKFSTGTVSSVGAAGYLVSRRGIGTADEAVRDYNSLLDVQGRQDFPHIAHFRIATAGGVTVANAHPFAMTRGHLIHNGHFSGGGDNNHSDTYYFSRALSDKLTPDISDEQVRWLESRIGSNKVAILWDTGTTTIINKARGTVLENGIWVSNTYFAY